MRSDEYELLRQVEGFVRHVAERDAAFSVEAQRLVKELDARGSLEEMAGADAVTAEAVQRSD